MLAVVFQKLKYCQLTFLFFNILLTATFALDHNSNHWGVTKIIAKKISYTWIINNYSLNDVEYGHCFYSPQFSNDDGDNYHWRLILCPNGWKSAKYMAMYVKVDNAKKLKARFTFNIIDKAGKKVNTKSDSVVFTKEDVTHGYNEMILLETLKNDKKNLVPDDNLTVFAEIFINNGTSDIAGERCSTESQDYNVEQMLTLFEDSLFSDVELRADGRVFKAHRGILAAHSSWFLEKFQAFPNTPLFDIENISSKALKEVLRYIYTGKIKNLELVAKELFDVSNWLGIRKLKSVCEIALCKTITSNNAIEILTLAELYDAEDLKRQASNYIVTHTIDVVDSPDFKSLQKSNPHPLFEIFHALINKSKA